MKKTYMKPEMDVEILELENMIAASPVSKTDDDAWGVNDVSGVTMEGKDRDDSDWGGLW